MSHKLVPPSRRRGAAALTRSSSIGRSPGSGFLGSSKPLQTNAEQADDKGFRLDSAGLRKATELNATSVMIFVSSFQGMRAYPLVEFCNS